MAALAGVILAAPLQARQTVWRFDRTDRLGGLATTVLGHPAVLRDAGHKAVLFDGVGDALLVGAHPLAGAGQFTVEAMLRPDGGAFEQRWLHLASDDPVSQTRIMFEIRVTKDGWYLDAFIKGKGYAQVLIDPAKLHPLGRWYHVAQSFDGTTYRSYVNGVLEGEAKVAGFSPQPEGSSAVGMRMNRVNFFQGAIRSIRFTDRALSPARFHKGGIQPEPMAAPKLP
ncbi:LamG domain-containing protein [Novosphingobium umbonatum]|uniref:LamG domain-containing protein n=1 Tax=Novosphingobium umbonatum TaxID=1908524 RepID=A0A3S2UQ93_9SPHN|nr:LamG domain-containing protein [Novosphingobium umbonatum]